MLGAGSPLVFVVLKGSAFYNTSQFPVSGGSGVTAYNKRPYRVHSSGFLWIVPTCLV